MTPFQTQADQDEFQVHQAAVHRELDAADPVRFADIRAWASTLPPGPLRAAYEFWLPHFQRRETIIPSIAP